MYKKKPRSEGKAERGLDVRLSLWGEVPPFCRKVCKCGQRENMTFTVAAPVSSRQLLAYLRQSFRVGDVIQSARQWGLALPRTLSRAREGEGAWDAFPILASREGPARHSQTALPTTISDAQKLSPGCRYRVLITVTVLLRGP